MTTTTSPSSAIAATGLRKSYGDRLVLDELSIPIPVDVNPLIEEGQQVTMGVRRETVRISMEAHPTNGIHLQAEAEAFESDFVHHTQTVFLRMGRFAFSGVCPLDIALRVGQSVFVEIDPESLYFFDTRSGRRL